MLPRSPAAKSEPQWPPRSPRDALLSTPGGRARLARLQASRTSPSPSPSRLRTTRPDPAVLEMNDDGNDEDDDDDDDEDEEMLQLQLQEIQAKLRLKKLQAAKAHKSASAGPATASASISASATTARQRPRSPPPPPRRAVEVPASPVRRTAAQLAAESAATAAAQKSPKRVLLGIDKGLRGQDVSLKRPPTAFRRGGGLPMSASVSSVGLGGGGGGDDDADAAPARPMTFNERLAAARNQEASRQDKSERIQRLRTSAFPVGKEEMEQYKTQAVHIPTATAGAEPGADRPPQYSRDEILGAALGRKPAAVAAGDSGTQQLLRRRNTVGAVTSAALHSSSDGGSGGGTDGSDANAVSFEPYSGYHLSRRVLPHAVLTRAVKGKTTYSIKDLLRDVKAPDFELPAVETDVVVFGIVASKSTPRAHKPGVVDEEADVTGERKQATKRDNKDRGKYMVLTLVDLTYQIDLFLFDSGFDRFWKLSTGTVVGILNPGVMPPPPGRVDTGRWSLVINSDADTILELGTARDLGYCKSVKRDGQLCNDWVHARRTEYCAFHTNEGLRKVRATRNEVNGAVGFGSTGSSDRGGGGWRGRGGGGGGRGGRGGGSGGGGNGPGYDAYAQSRYYMVGQSASALLDHDNDLGGYADQAERKEGLKRRLAARERESTIARQLGQLGSGAGRDYMQAVKAAEKAEAGEKGGETTKTAASAPAPSSVPAPASSSNPFLRAATADEAAASRASLLASITSTNRARAGTAGAADIQLGGPPKRKRPASSVPSASASTLSAASTPTITTTTATAEAGGTGGFGWGSNLHAKLGRMKDGERLQTAQSSIEAGFRRQQTAATTTTTSTTPATTPATVVAEEPPARKKTRFLIGGKGIREAGRESLGAATNAAAASDEDELVII